MYEQRCTSKFPKIEAYLPPSITVAILIVGVAVLDDPNFVPYWESLSMRDKLIEES